MNYIPLISRASETSILPTTIKIDINTLKIILLLRAFLEIHTDICTDVGFTLNVNEKKAF